MRYRSMTGSVLTVLAFAAAAAAFAGPQGQGKRPTLDQLTESNGPERQPDGHIHWRRSFKEAIPWNDYLAALAAEQQSTTESLTVVEGMTASTQEMSAALATCTPPDTDYDGDSFLGTDDQFPLRRGEYIADRPRIRAQFTSFIDAALDYKLSGSTTITHDETRFYETDLIEKTEAKETREMKKKFNGSFGLKLGFASGKAPVVSLDLGLGGEVERQRTYSWSRTKTESVETKYTDVRKKSETSQLTLEPYSGKVSGQVTMYNESDYAIDIDVSNVRIAIVAYSPFTGAKYALGDVLLTGQTFPLGYGSGNNSASSFVQLSGLNTFDMMNRLAEGWVFDMEIASYTAFDRNTGANVGSIISKVNQRNSRISIHYGDTTARQYGQVSVFQPANACLTAKDMLVTFVGAAYVEFDRMPDGTLIVKRINHRTNTFADRDFDSLTPSEQAQYGRWVVGYQYYNQPLTSFDLENTLLAPEDKVFFYFLTAADFKDDPGPPDVNVTSTVANNGSFPLTANVTPVSTFDTVELTVKNTFQIEEAYTQSVGNIWNANCGYVFGATWYGHRVKTDSTLHSINIPNVDWYGLQVDFGGTGYRTIASLLADTAASGSITSFRGFPYYDYTVKLKVTPAMLGSYPTRNLFIKSANPRQTFLVGYEGTGLNGGHVSCRWNDVGGFYKNETTVKDWWKIDNTDGDQDAFYAASATGIDFDDVNARRFPFAPEHLDGIDNNGDGAIDNAPLICPDGLRSFDTGTCKLDNRTGWYPATPNTLIERRFKLTNGTFTAWETIGSGLTTYTFTMTSDPAQAAMEVRTTYYPAGGGTFSGVNTINHLPGGDVPTFAVGVDVEAESGRIVSPMRVDTVGSDTFVHVPTGSQAYAPAAAEWKFQVTQTFDYIIQSRVYATSSGDDSFLVSVFDPQGNAVNPGFVSPAHFRFETANPPITYGAFSWTKVNHWNPYVSPQEYVNPVVYHLTPGTYLVQFRPRELGSRLDKLRVEKLCPDADGDGWTTCAGDCNDANAAVNPGHAEVCSTSIDDDCDGYINEGCGGGGSPVYRKVPIEVF